LMKVYLVDFERRYHYTINLENGLIQNGVKVGRILYPDLISTFFISINGGVLHINWPEYFYKMGRGIHKSLPSILLTLNLIISILIARYLYGMRLVFSLHNLMPHSRHRRWLDRLVYTAMVSASYRVVCHCDVASSLVREAFNLCYKKIRIIPHPNFNNIYAKKIEKVGARKALGLETGVYIYLYFGKIRRYKGLGLLITEFKNVCNEDDRLLIVGSDDGSGYADELKLLSGNDKQIIIHNGWVSDEEVSVYFSSADCLVLPYIDVLTSGPVLLSAQFQIPLIAPRVGCIPEQTDNEMSILYDEGGLSDALISIKGLDVRMVERASKSVMAKTNLSIVIQRMIEEVYA